MPGAIVPYRETCRHTGCTDFHMDGIKNRLDAFNQFVVDHPERMKQPGLTRGL